MSLKHGILGLLNAGSMTGYEVDRSFKRSLNHFWQAQTSQIYRELSAMEDKGWLQSEQIIQTDKPNKRVYSLTNTGEQELQRWLMDSEIDIAKAMTVRSAFLMRVFLADELPKAEVLVMFQDFKEKCLETLASFDLVREKITNYGTAVHEKRVRYWELTVMYGEGQCRAALEWVERAMAMIESD
ncbi:PadR family transcriptional regulator [uncultured Enterococcus sp.]|uniref:PadR family transcriptional regulator n=1 Tax=uncultured Enterococcus sp. TaxID=167972 RepID=UPI002AA6A7AA|nr:PadR family transcriptional regulator [uncultured Enterococcus sp.]